jgi:elongation factor P
MKAKDVRRGTVLKFKNGLYSVMDFHHHTPGNLRAMVQMKLRNLMNGTQTEHRFSSTEDIETADVFNQPATFLYGDQNGYHFMNSETYEEVTLSDELIGDGKYYVQEGMQVQLSMYEENPIGIQLPQTVTLTIAETEPGLRGATASNSPKPAKTDTGLQLAVPPFVNIGDQVVVNTETGEYLSRA